MDRPFVPLRVAVLTISDTRTLETDKSGATIVRLLEDAGHATAARLIVTDDADPIREAVALQACGVSLTRLLRPVAACSLSSIVPAQKRPLAST